MRCLALTLALIGSTAGCAVGQAAQERCEAPEVLQLVVPEYNDLVCDGLNKMEHGAYEDAARDFERAMEIRLFDTPNFQLFPRLAIAYWRAGNTERAHETLEKARLSLHVFFAIYRCQETASGFVLVDRYGAPISSAHTQEIMNRMCGAAYDYVYERDSLERFVDDARLIELYLRARKLIAPE